MSEEGKIFHKIGLDGKILNLSEKNVDLTLVKEVVNAHADVVDTRTYTDIDFSVEYSFYTDDFKNEIIKNENNIETFYEINKLETKHSSLTFEEISFNEDMTQCEVLVIDQFRCIQVAEDSFLFPYQDKILSQKRKYSLVLEDGEWKIDDIQTDIK